MSKTFVDVTGTPANETTRAAAEALVSLRGGKYRGTKDNGVVQFEFAQERHATAFVRAVNRDFQGLTAAIEE